MKHSIIYHIACLLVTVLTCGACQDLLEEDSINNNVLTLQLQTSAITRVPEEGEDRFNENMVERVDVFFFNNNSSTGTCLYAQTGLKPNGNTLQVTLDRNIIENKTYYIYVVANYDLVGNDNATDKTLGDLQNTVLTTQWKDGYAEDGSSSMEDVIEQSLAMDGSTTISITDEGATGQVDLKRAMAKIMLYVTTEQNIEYNGMTYRPDNDHMFATMVYAVKRTDFSNNYQVKTGNVDAEGTVIESTSDYIIRMRRDYDSEHTEEVTIEGEDGTPGTYNRYEQVAPFYSYPNPEDTENRMESYLILCVPWIVTAGGDDASYQSFNYYYRVPITGTDAPALLERNHYYKVNAHIGVLGSINPHEAVEIDANFEILDWFDMDIDADMQKYEYLVLSEYNSVMNNVDNITISYASSSNIKSAEITEISYWDYHDADAKHMYYGTWKQGYMDEEGNDMHWVDSDIPTEYQVSWDEENDQLIFTHKLDADDYVALTITIRVTNEDYVSEEWMIIQYPAMYIVGEYNDNGLNNRFVYGYTNNRFYWSGEYNDYLGESREVHDDSTDRGNNLGGVHDPRDNATNCNLNQYTIYISSFDAGDKYAIGDPRSEEVDNLTYLNRYINGRNLTYYYPTRQENVNDILAHGSVVAPAFKIASSWGVVSSGSLNYDTAKRRCASYQENGYPAGRWRLPTEGEIEYIVGLSDAGKIPALFNGDYYASSGRYYDNGYNDYTGTIDYSRRGFHPSTPNEDGEYEPTSGHSVRCVYDVWYWGDDKIQNPDRFTWGDQPRE